MNQFMVTPQENFQWTRALRANVDAANEEPILTFPLRSYKGVESEFTHWLTEQLTLGRKRITKPTVQAAKCIALNVACAISLGANTGIVHSFSKRLKAIPKRFRREPYSRDTMNTLLAQAERLGLIKIKRGFKNESHVSGISSLILPTESIIAQAQLLNDKEITDISVPIDPLILRNNRWDYVNYSDKPATRRMRQSIQEQNEVRSSCKWTYTLADNNVAQMSHSDLSCRRIFKGRWSVGGRFYCDAQNLPKAIRRTITINGEPTVEVDYKSMHPRLLYHLAGMDAPSNCYDIGGIERGKVKKIALIATSTSSRAQAVRSAAFHLKTTFKEADNALTRFESRHRDTSSMFYQEKWKWLQHQDSLIADHVLNTMRDLDIPTLPIHDSFIVPASSASALSDSMNEAYQHITGFEPALSLNA